LDRGCVGGTFPANPNNSSSFSSLDRPTRTGKIETTHVRELQNPKYRYDKHEQREDCEKGC